MPTRRNFTNARSNAKRRGIPWDLTYEQWASVWIASGQYTNRGRSRGQYQMDRIDNSRGYSADNVQVIAGAVNRTKDAPHGHVAKLTEQSVAAIRAAFKPRVVTRQHLAAQYGVTVACIKAVLSGRNWQNLREVTPCAT